MLLCQELMLENSEALEDMILEMCSLEEGGFELRNDEDMVFNTTGFKLSSQGRFRFQKNWKESAGNIYVTTKRLVFVSRIIGGDTGITGGGDISIPIESIKNAFKGKFSIPNLTASLGTSKLISMFFRQGYVVVEYGKKYSSKTGFFCNNPEKLINVLVTLAKRKS